MSDLLVSVVSFLSATVFAAVWGAHVFETIVLFRVWADDPPKALPAFVTTPYSVRAAGFWRVLAPGLYVIASAAVIVAVVAGLPLNYRFRNDPVRDQGSGCTGGGHRGGCPTGKPAVPLLRRSGRSLRE